MSERVSPRRIVFHIGLERTGTTCLQYFCFQNRDRLSDNSVLYPTRNLGFRNTNHVDLVASYLPPDPNDIFVRSGEVEKNRVLDSLLDEIEGSDARTILVSAEHFSSRFRAPQIQQLAEDFASFDCKIVVFVRDHLSRFYSAYATHVAGGGQLRIEEYAEEILHPDNLAFRYADTIGSWEQAFGRATIDIRRYRRGQDVIARFFDENGATPLGADFVAATKTDRLDLLAIRDNRSLGPRQTERLRAANVRIARLRGPSFGLDRSARYFTMFGVGRFLHMTGWIERFLGRNKDPGWRLDSARLGGLMAIARSDEDWLKKRQGVSLDPPSFAPGDRVHEDSVVQSDRHAEWEQS